MRTLLPVVSSWGARKISCARFGVTLLTLAQDRLQSTTTGGQHPMERSTSRVNYIFPPPPIVAVPVLSEKKYQQFPVRRIYLVGRNYAAHTKEMGGDPDRETTFFFQKPRDAIVYCDGQEPATISYPLSTHNLHHEIELVVAMGRTACDLTSADEANDCIFGYAVGVDLTRRDLQAAAKKDGRPWDAAKAFDESAPIGNIHRRSHVTETQLQTGDIWLTVNGEQRQSGALKDMIWSVPEVVVHLSRQFRLEPGDLIYTGTPSGVGPLNPGDCVVGGIDGLSSLSFTISE